MTSVTSDYSVKATNLSFTYERGPEALKGMSFEMEPGDIMGVVGANGAGKTTLCFHLNGVIPTVYAGKERGHIEMCGLDPWETPIIKLAEKACMVLQDPESQFTTTNVASELAFGPANLGVDRETILERSKWAAKVCGIDGLEERKPKELSGGQKQRVALAAGLTMLPEVLILDEPTSQLDPIGSTEVFDVINQLSEREDMTIMITSHKTDEISRLATKVMVLEEGEIKLLGTPREVFEETELLDSVGVNPPQMASLTSQLAEKIPGFKQRYRQSGGIPLTLEEGESLMKDSLDSGFLQVNWKEPPAPPEVEDDPVLEMDNVTFVYPAREPVTALRDVSLTINRGEYVAIIGQNGSGKTTLVKHFLGLLNPVEGFVRVEGEDVAELTTGSIAKRAALILQNPDYQLFSISVEKELEFGLDNLDIDEETKKERIETSLKEVGLEGVRDTFPFRLSFGERRKVAAAAGIAMDPDVLILDEPTTAQDYWGRHRLCQIGEQMREQGKTVVMISHDMELIATYADRLVIMSDAEIIADGPKREVFEMHDILQEANLKPPPITQLSQRLKDYGIKRSLMTVEEMVDVFERGGM